MRRRCILVLALVAPFFVACEGDGEGQLSGSLFLRGCPALDPTRHGDVSGSELPSPLPDFSLSPQNFYVEIITGVRTGLRADPRTPDRLLLRMQRGSNKLERADGFELLVHDISQLEMLQAKALADGKAGAPIVPPPLDMPTVMLPGDPDATVRAGLLLNNSCRHPLAQPSLRGTVRFSEIGRTVGEHVAGEVDVTVEDLRAMREQAGARVVPDVVGSLRGWFRIPIQSGPASPAQ